MSWRHWRAVEGVEDQARLGFPARGRRDLPAKTQVDFRGEGSGDGSGRGGLQWRRGAWPFFAVRALIAAVHSFLAGRRCLFAAAGRSGS